jgi:hypothetical protein
VPDGPDRPVVQLRDLAHDHALKKSQGIFWVIIPGRIQDSDKIALENVGSVEAEDNGRTARVGVQVEAHLIPRIFMLFLNRS